MPNHHKGGSVEGRPDAIKQEIRNLITYWATEDREHQDMDRVSLAENLVHEIIHRGEIAPTVKTLMAYISTVRNLAKDDVDYPWSMSTLRDSKFALPIESIPYVVEVQHKQRSIEPVVEVSIRQAQWIGRLCKVVTNIEALAQISCYYALYERVTQKAGTSFDTSGPDSFLPHKEKVIGAFQNLLQAANFEAVKIAFDDAAGTKTSDDKQIIIKTVYLTRSNAAAVLTAEFEDDAGHKIGERDVIVKNLGTRVTVLAELTRLGLIKPQKTYPDGYINLRKSVAIEKPEAELLKLEDSLKTIVNEQTQNKDWKFNNHRFIAESVF